MTTTLLTVDAGSSSVKLATYAAEDVSDPKGTQRPEPNRTRGQRPLRCTAQTQAAIAGANQPTEFGRLLREFIRTSGISDVRAVAHRIVHGGTAFSASRTIDIPAEQELASLAELAPLHMPTALELIRQCRDTFGADIPQIAVFDTAFFAGLPAVARHYAISPEMEKTHGVRRFGFHGLAHASMLGRIRELRPDLDDGGRLITIQLGAGCSMAAIDRGRPLDSSMGFSPLEGLVMATRSGDIDPGLLIFLQRRFGFTPESLDRLLNSESGLLGVSGSSGDMRVLLESNDPDSRLAVDLYCYRVRKYIGSYLAVLGGADAIAIGGGVGENSAEIRERIFAGMEWCGIVLDRARNAAARGTGGNELISAPAGSVEVWVIAVDEGREMAREAVSVLDALQPQSGRVQRQPLSST